MKIRFRVRDYSDEYSGSGVLVPDLNTVDSLWADADALADALAAHIQAHSIGTLVSVYAQQDTQAENDARPANAFAQRELAFRFYLRDSVTGDLGQFTVPAADLGIASYTAGTDLLDLSAEPTASFVTWLETNAQSGDGNAVVVEKALVVGRNS